MKPVNVGVIGAGEIATTTHIPVLRALDAFRVAWVADANEDRAKKVASANGLTFAPFAEHPRDLPPCDLVLLAIPLPGRTGYFEHFAGGSTAVLAEKPLATRAAEHARLVAAYDAWRLNVCYMRRCYATVQMMRTAHSSGVFGDLREIVIREGGRMTRTGGAGAYQDVSVAEGGGVVKNLGCHGLDAALWITAARRFEVMERAIEWDGQTDRHCDATVVLKDLEGRPGHHCKLSFTVSWLLPQPATLTMHFERAVLSAPIAPSRYVTLQDRDGRRLARIDAMEPGVAETSYQAFSLGWRAAHEALASRTEGLLSGRSCRTTADLMDVLLER